MNPREAQILSRAVGIFKKYLKPRRIILFGSRAKAEKKESHSDFDFAVDAAKPPITVARRITEELEEISGLYKIDVVYLSSVKAGFRDIILKTGRVANERRD